ncbi:hypothetical protein QQF64_006508 [Cirrhinus molitorella]|uniref:Transposase n=1 Tax=Cirrhinus molitorella TaxID=172907 RepID=A0ABR3MC29_9TELE
MRVLILLCITGAQRNEQSHAASCRPTTLAVIHEISLPTPRREQKNNSVYRLSSLPKDLRPTVWWDDTICVVRLHVTGSGAEVASALTETTRVALTCDAWTSRATKSFVTFTAHYITNTWVLESRVLQTRVMHESHTAVNVNAMFHSVANEWELTVSDLVIVTDNAANMLAAALIDNLAHISCFAHTLQPAVTKRAMKLPTVSGLHGWIRRHYWFLHRSRLANHELIEKQNFCSYRICT